MKSEYLLIYLCILFTISEFSKFFKKYKKSVTKQILQTNGFENDILFLNNLIAIAIRDYERFIITPAKAAGKSLMTDDEVKKYREGIIVNIYSQMSEAYINSLLVYFSKDGLMYYISNTINNELMNLTLKHNMKFMSIFEENKNSSGKEKKKDVTNVHKTDIE